MLESICSKRISYTFSGKMEGRMSVRRFLPTITLPIRNNIISASEISEVEAEKVKR